MRIASLAALAGLVAHHAFEDRRGLGLPLEPEVGRPVAVAGWTAGVAVVAGLAVRRGTPSTVLAGAAGAQLAIVAVHYASWPTSWRRGVPTLLEVEGLATNDLPSYNRLLRGWGLAALAAAAAETRSPEALALLGFGLATVVPDRWAAERHWRWLTEQALVGHERGDRRAVERPG